MKKIIILMLLVISGVISSSLVFGATENSCRISISSKNTVDLFEEIDGLNEQLNKCQPQIPGPANRLIKNGNTIINVNSNDGKTNSMTIIIKNKEVSEIQKGANSKCSQKITISESDLDSALQSSSLNGAMAYLFGQDKIKVQGCSIGSKMKFMIINPFAKYFVKKQANSMPN